MRHYLWNVLKVTLIVVVIAGVGLSAFFALRPLIVHAMLTFADEPVSNVELFESFFRSPPVVLGTVLVAVLIACGAGWLVEMGWNRLEAIGYIPAAAQDVADTRVTLKLWCGNNVRKSNSDPLFAMKVESSKLLGFFRNREIAVLTCKKVDGSTLKLSRVKSRQAATAAGQKVKEQERYSVQLIKNNRVLYAFQTIDDGLWWKNDEKSVAYCHFPLAYPGMEEKANVTMGFYGASKDIEDIFAD